MLSPALFWLAWAAAMTLFWLLAIGVFSRLELVAALLGGAIAATAMLTVRRQRLLGFVPDPPWLARLPRALWQIVREFGVVAAALITRPAGLWRGLEFPAGGDDARSAGRRAIATWGETLSPNSILVDIDRDGVALRHDLDPRQAPDRVL